MRIPKLVSLAFAALLLGLAARAEAHQVRYEGMHPVPAEYGGGFCEIDFPHVHVFEPQRPDVLYRNHDHGYAFVGDPVPYGYQGPKHAYYGPHPFQDEAGDLEYCYLEGPHYHVQPPPGTIATNFRLKGGVYFYSGHFPQTYYEAKPRYAKINVIYRPLEYQRPVVVAPETDVVVESSPPAAVVVPGQPAVIAGVGVTAGVGIHAGIGAGVVIGAPPPPTVIIGAPPPVVVVHERRPRTVIVEERRPRTIIVEDRRHEVIHVKEKKEPRGHAWGRGW